MLLALFTFQVAFIDYHGHSIETNVTFPDPLLLSQPKHLFYSDIGGYNDLCKLDKMTGNIWINIPYMAGMKIHNHTFYVTKIAIKDTTPFDMAYYVASRLFDYTIPVGYENGKYIFERRFWSWDDVKEAWSQAISSILN